MNRLEKTRKFVLPAALVCALCLTLCGCFLHSTGKGYTIAQVDLSVRPDFASGAEYDDLFAATLVDGGDGGEGYLAHPDSVVTEDGGREIIRTFYPKGHGRGALVEKVSADGGETYGERIENLPESWENSMETPTVYELDFTDGGKKLVLISANPEWGDLPGSGDGFNASVSDDGGETWTEFKKFYGKDDPALFVKPIVAMSALVRLKENGAFVDKWMGLFHDNEFKNYKTILTFKDGEMHWSVPEEYFKGKKKSGKVVSYADIAKRTAMCEVEVIRSDKGAGDRLCLITRSNTKSVNSLISYSDDEGESWSYPKEAPAALNGERHKAEYAPDGRLLITFRSIERKKTDVRKYTAQSEWYSQGLVGWVGTFDDLIEGRQGQYRIKLAHVYLEGQTSPETNAGADTGYCGNVVLKDGTFVVSSYGKFFPDLKRSDNGEIKTVIVSKRINLNLTDNLYRAITNRGGL